MATRGNENDRRAEAAWSEVQATPDADLKSLIMDVSIALAKKKEQERQRTGKYSKGKKAALSKVQKAEAKNRKRVQKYLDKSAAEIAKSEAARLKKIHDAEEAQQEKLDAFNEKQDEKLISAGFANEVKKRQIKESKRTGAKKGGKKKIKVLSKKTEAKEEKRVDLISKAYDKIDDLESETLAARIEAEFVLREFQANIDKALATPSNVSGNVVSELEREYGRVMAFVRDGKFGPNDPIHEQISRAFESLTQLKNIAKSNEEESRRRRIERLNMMKVAFFNKSVEMKDKLTSGVKKGMDFISSKLERGPKAEAITAPTEQGPIVAKSAEAKEKTTAVSEPVAESKADQVDAVAEKVAEKVEKNIAPSKTTTSAEWSKEKLGITEKRTKDKEEAKEKAEGDKEDRSCNFLGSSIDWVKKQLKSIGSSIWRVVTSPVRTIKDVGSKIFDTLMTAAAVAPLVVPLIQGINQELEKQFGEHYIRDFIQGLWDNSWGWLVKKIKDLLGIKEPEPPTAAETAAEEARQAVVEVMSDPESTTSEQLSAKLTWLKEKQTVSGETKGNLWKAQRVNPMVLKQRRNIETAIQDAEPNTIDPELAKELTEAGFVVPKEKISKREPAQQKETATPKAVSAPAPAGGGDMGGSPARVTAAGVFRAPTPWPPSNQAPATSAKTVVEPAGATQPQPAVTVPEPDNKPAATTGQKVGALGVGGTPALGVTQVPTFASAESLHIMNTGVLTAST